MEALVAEYTDELRDLEKLTHWRNGLGLIQRGTPANSLV